MPEFVNPFSGMRPDRNLDKRELLRSLRLSLSAEEEATHLYEALADATDDPLAKQVLQDVANEERVHKGEFQRLITLLARDEEDYMTQGAEEVNEMQHGVTEPDAQPHASAETATTQIPTVGDLTHKD